MKSQIKVGVVNISDNTLGELTNSIQTVTLKEDEEAKEPGSELGTGTMSSKLKLIVSSRLKLAEAKRSAMKTTWLELTRKEVSSGLEFQSKMEDCLLLHDDWQHVLKHLEESKDKALLSRMDLVWWELLKKDRTSFLFHEVFPVLFQTMLVDSPEVVNCREVSRKWKDSVDDLIQDPVLAAQRDMVLWTSPRDPSWSLNIHLFLTGGFHQLAGPQQPQQPPPDSCLCCKLELYPGEIPFFTRRLMVADCAVQAPEEMPQFIGRVMLHLDRWGGSLWQIGICLRMSLHLTLGSSYEDICRILGATPNLRNMTLASNDFASAEEMAHYLDVPERRLNFKLGPELLDLNALPELPQLRVLHTNMVCFDLHHVLFRRYGATLELLFIIDHTGVTGDYINGSRLPQLKQFCFVSYNNEHEDTESSFTLDWPSIQEFRYVHFNVGAKSVPVIFRNLNGLGKSLRKLILLLEKNKGPISKLERKEVNSLSLELPLVEELFLFVSRVNLSRIDFILPMASLKELNLYYGKPEKKVVPAASTVKKEQKLEPVPGSGSSSSNPGDEIIQFSNYTNRLYESNIWSLFPELRKVTINIVSKSREEVRLGLDYDKSKMKRKVYTREGFQNYCK